MFHLVERMNPDMGAPQCLTCGKGNTPGDTGEIGPFLDLERDVNWGDPAYLCVDCGTKIGAMFGMATPDDVKDLQNSIKAKDKRIHDLESNLELKSRRLTESEHKLETVVNAKKIVKAQRTKAA